MKRFAALFLSLFILISTVAPSYTFAETSNKKTGWVIEGEKRYYYDRPGVKHTGLLQTDEDTYLFDKEGNLSVGWNTINGNNYFFDTVTGAAQKGWFNQATHWYYADDSGVIQKGNVTYKGKQFQFDQTGKMIKGWVKLQSLENVIYGSRTILKGVNPQKVGDDEILEVVGEDGSLWFKVNYKGNTYVVKKLHVVVFDQSLATKIENLRRDIIDIKNGVELVKKYSKRLTKANEEKKYDEAIYESSELAHSISQILSTVKKTDFKSVIDRISEKESDPTFQIKYKSIITNLTMMEEDLKKIHKISVLKDSLETLEQANKNANIIIDNVNLGKEKINLGIEEVQKYKQKTGKIFEFKRQLVELYSEFYLNYYVWLAELIAYPVQVLVPYAESVEQFTDSLPKEELKKHADGFRDYVAEVKDVREGFKSRIPAYKQMASDLHTFNKSVAKFADSVETAGAAIHKTAVQADELYKSVSTHLVEAQQAFPDIHTDIMSGLDAANNIMGSVNKLASHKVDFPAAARNIGNIDLTNSLRDLGANPDNVYSNSDDKDLSFMLDITPGIGTAKQAGELIAGKDLATKEKYGPSDYAWGTLSLVSGGITKVIGKSFGTVADLERKGKNLEKAAKGAQSGEIILDKVKTYEQARNQAMNILGNLGSDSIPMVGTMKKSAGYGKIIGRQTADKKARWRLDYDPEKGLHMNVEDFRNGKGSKSTKYAIPIEGDEELFKSLLKHLNK
ncbi:pre-toxin TG domain-containing protein [Bacillus pseudomycoides]|uniref:pre-toxin TG domain-containing protein n=2 Tax=Bacillus pseudomycoides TaxID=64104 RepID=UPI000BEC64D7|nr:pre-toxin TG domain-containing protein [Bacillus pseudomycoides]PED69607.1 hypothetical protein CON97_24225 [Bacillus pseudomycoides]PGC17626.1 hypothetical protein COM11_28640 [Bacillus pseudomycoides]PHB00712.1 hypothetical protein COE85_30220 [Bacillus pseudomycoides]